MGYKDRWLLRHEAGGQVEMGIHRRSGNRPNQIQYSSPKTIPSQTYSTSEKLLQKYYPELSSQPILEF